jgi:hypothetical protein
VAGSISCEFLDGTDGIKCDEVDACFGTNAAKIGWGSCLGTQGCKKLGANVIIGKKICLKEVACLSGYIGYLWVYYFIFVLL